MVDVQFQNYQTWYNVKDWGAVGDGVHDDRAAIQNAITTAQDTAAPNKGGVIFFPVGQYLISSSLIVDNSGSSIRFLGVGGEGLNNCGSYITGSFPDYLIRSGASGSRMVTSIEYLGFRQQNATTVNCTTPQAARLVPNWDPARSYGAWPDITGGPSQVYSDPASGGDGKYYNSLQPSNLNHNPAGGANPTWWGFVIDGATIVAAGCLQVYSEKLRIIGCYLTVQNGIAIFTSSNNVEIQNCGITSNQYNSSLGPGQNTGQSVGVMFANGRVTGSRMYALGTAINTFSSGVPSQVDNMIFEVNGCSIKVGTLPYTWFDQNNGGFQTSTNAGTATTIHNVSNESCNRGIDCLGFVDVDNWRFEYFATGSADYGIRFSGSSYCHLRKCLTSGNITGAGIDFTNIGGNDNTIVNACTFGANPGQTQVILPNMAGIPRTFIVQNSNFDGALPLAQLPSPFVQFKGMQHRCSNSIDGVWTGTVSNVGKPIAAMTGAGLTQTISAAPAGITDSGVPNLYSGNAMKLTLSSAFTPDPTAGSVNITISGATGGANGTWIANRLTATTYLLLGSQFTGTGGGGSATLVGYNVGVVFDGSNWRIAGP